MGAPANSPGFMVPEVHADDRIVGLRRTPLGDGIDGEAGTGGLE